MSLRSMLSKVTFVEERDDANNVIQLRAPDLNKLSDEIMALDVAARTKRSQIADVRRSYEETIAVMEAELDETQTELDAKRAEWRQHSELIGGV